MPDATPPPFKDRNMLFGVLAVQLDFINRDDLQDALTIWEQERSRSIGQILVERRHLSPRRRSLMEQLLDEYLLEHNMDSSRGLAAACEARQSPFTLEALTSRALLNSLGTLPTSPPTLGGPPPPDKSPQSVGLTTSSGKRFRIIRSHARGALGEVFLAHDEELNREVALKEIQQPYASHPDSRERFLLEAEITGSLEHPGVVPVYGLGRYADGRPYYAMRFIKGMSLHDAIYQYHHTASDPKRDPGENALALRGLLMRFVAVCNAIAYAHSRGVVHRDIKPSNIMLGSYGETLVVDWGLAKAFDRPMTHDSREIPLHPVSGSQAQATMLGQAIGTPSYMSPEQAAGKVDKIGTASDIYSLGATLYQILTGVPPYNQESATEIMKRVQINDFPAPRKIKLTVPKPLESIVLKAMALNPDNRYPSVSKLAREVERWLADEPVIAHRASLVERGVRWMRRHRTLVAGLGALLLTALVGLGIGLYAVGRQRDIANKNLGLAQKAVDECFVLATEKPLLQQERMRGVRKLLLEAALPYYRDFQSQRPDNDGFLLEQGRNNFRLGIINTEIGRKAAAEDSFTRSRSALAKLVQRHPGIDDLQSDLARVLNNLGILQRELGKAKDANASLEQAMQIREVLAKGHPDREDYQSDLATTYNNLGILLRGLEQPVKAQTYFDDARKILAELVFTNPHNPRHRADLAATYHNLARLQAQQGDNEDSLASYAEAIRIRKALVKEFPDQSEYRADLASTLINRAQVLVVERRYEEASRHYEEALVLSEALVRDQSDVPEYREDLARACNGLGALLRTADRQDPVKIQRYYRKIIKQTIDWFLVFFGPIDHDAMRLLERARDVQKVLVNEHAEVPGHRIDLAGTLLNLGHAWRDEGQNLEAVRVYTQAVNECNLLPQTARKQRLVRDLLSKAYAGRAEALGSLGRYPDALPDWEQAIHLAVSNSKEELRIRRGFALIRAKQYRQAVTEVDELLLSPNLSAEMLYNLACIRSLAAQQAAKDTTLAESERATKANKLAEGAVEILRKTLRTRLFAEMSRRQLVQTDTDLDFLREREDFKAFVTDLKKLNDK